MNNNSLGESADALPFELTEEDMNKLFNYPSIGELFNDGDLYLLNDFRNRLNGTGEKLERLIRNGNRIEAESAEKASKAVKITLGFLESLEKMRAEEKK